MFNWKFHVYDKTNDDGNPVMGVDVIVLANTEKSALLNAKKVLKRKNYWLRECWLQKEDYMKSYIKELQDFMKKHV